MLPPALTRAAAQIRQWRERVLRRAPFDPAAAHVDRVALAHLARLPGGYVPWSLWAPRPSAVATMLNDIVLNDRSQLVECGAGVTTIFTARLLRQRGRGRLTSIEDDPGWAEVVRASLAAEGLGQHVSVVDAPLAPSSHSWSGAPWYDETVLGALDLDGIDLLFVDGPKAARPADPHARYPALPFFWPRMAERCTVILDDAQRAGEQEVAERWAAEQPIAFELLERDGSIALGRAGGGFDVRIRE